MLRVWHRMRQLCVRVGPVLLAVALVLVPLPSWSRAVLAQAPPRGQGIELTTLATRSLDEAPPDRRWVLRRGHPLNGDAHAHAGGFIYAAVGRSYLVVDDTQGAMMEEGRAA